MDIVRMVRSSKITHLPGYALHAAQHQLQTIKQDVRDWAAVVDFVVHPVDVQLGLESTDIYPPESQKPAV